MEELTAAERNELKAYVNTESGRKLLLVMANYELNLQAESWSPKVTSEKQLQNINMMHGIYWVRSLIADLIK